MLLVRFSLCFFHFSSATGTAFAQPHSRMAVRVRIPRSLCWYQRRNSSPFLSFFAPLRQAGSKAGPSSASPPSSAAGGCVVRPSVRCDGTVIDNAL